MLFECIFEFFAQICVRVHQCRILGHALAVHTFDKNWPIITPLPITRQIRFDHHPTLQFLLEKVTFIEERNHVGFGEEL